MLTRRPIAGDGVAPPSDQPLTETPLSDTPLSDHAPGDAPRGRALGRGFAALSIRNYRLYWSGQVVSLIGAWMQQVSVPWLVLELGGSPLQLGLVAALQFGPALVLAPVGGVMVDRVDRRRLLIGTQLAAMAQAAALFLLTALGVVQIPMVMVLAFVLGIVNAVDMPVRQSLAADLVPSRMLPNAIALNSMAFNAARVVGPALGGVIIAAAGVLLGSAVRGIAVNLAVNAISYLAVLAALLRMDRSAIRIIERPERHPPVLTSLREGVRYATRTPLVLWSLVLLGGVAIFGFNFQILLPLFARDVLQLQADGYGALFAGMGIGSLAGSLTLAYLVRRPAIALMLGGAVAFAALELALGLSRAPWLAAALVIGIGYASMLMINTINNTIQANVSDALRGRVMSLYVTVFVGTAPLGGLFAGAAAEAFGTPLAFILGGLLSVVTVGVVAIGLRAATPRGHPEVSKATEPAARRVDSPTASASRR